jgi:hypothetical protein
LPSRKKNKSPGHPSIFRGFSKRHSGALDALQIQVGEGVSAPNIL